MHIQETFDYFSSSSPNLIQLQRNRYVENYQIFFETLHISVQKYWLLSTERGYQIYNKH